MIENLEGVPRYSLETDPIVAGIQRSAGLDRRISIMERAAPQRSMSISQNGRKRVGIGPFSSDGARYGIEIFDDTGAVQARLGELSKKSGTYGLEVLVPGGYYVPVASIAAGGGRQTIEGEYQRTAKTATSTGWLNIGPTLPVSTASGKLDVTVGGGLIIAGNKATVTYSFQVVDSTGTEVIAPKIRRGVFCTHDGYGMHNSQSSDRTLSFNLSPGDYRVNALFQVFAGAGIDGTGAVIDRTLAVQGF